MESLTSVLCFIPFALTIFRKPKSVEYIWVREDSFVSMSGTRRNGDFCACGNSHTVGKCERAQHETAHGAWEDAESESVPHTWGAWKGTQRTQGNAVKPLGLAEETVYLVYLVYPSFRPAFFTNHRVDLLPKGFYIFRMGKKTVQYLHHRLSSIDTQ